MALYIKKHKQIYFCIDYTSVNLYEPDIDGVT